MKEIITVSDADYNYDNLIYISHALGEVIEKIGGSASVSCKDSRALLEVETDNATQKFIRPTIEDKIADIITVNYKYSYFTKFIRTEGLSPIEFEILLSALISADIDDDKNYVRNIIRGSSVYAVDGAFNFMMKPLKSKWVEVVGFIPTSFSKTQLNDFVSYLIKEKSGKRVYVDKGKVYDKHFNRLTKTKLTSQCEATVLREIILSGAGEVELSSRLPETDEFYLKQFFGDKIFFRKSYFS